MSKKTGTGLAAYAKAQLGKPYWWGTFGQTATPQLLAQKRAQYPSYYQAVDFPAQFGHRVHDCVGLIKGYLWSETPTSPPVYGLTPDVAAYRRSPASAYLRRTWDTSASMSARAWSSRRSGTPTAS